MQGLQQWTTACSVYWWLFQQSQRPVDVVSLTPGRPTKEKKRVLEDGRANLKRKAQEEMKEGPPCKSPRLEDNFEDVDR
ncbi:uncharacterized protein LOC141881683 isoform X4 [Acropora palmata]|uniref:uncharacterized protein LOC141881683 isoform X4 n=1 Tax=Acropora palmata TaxID=6131 RepID=UPI003DA0D2B9